MARFVLVVDRTSTLDLSERLRRARDAMALGGSRETIESWLRPPLGVLTLSHDGRLRVVEAPDGTWLLLGAQDPEIARRRLRGSQRELTSLDEAPALAQRAALRWAAPEGELTLVTEPNGQLPLYVMHSAAMTIVATEPKAIWAVHPESLRLDSHALVDLYTLGHTLGPHTLFREVTCAEPGAVVVFGPEQVTQYEYVHPTFDESRRGDSEALAHALNRALLEVLERDRESFSRVTVALSGGMDSRYVLGGARRIWNEIDAMTFGDPGSADAILGAEVARRAGVPHLRYDTRDDFPPSWAPYAVWRTDGLLNLVHAQGMDAVIAHARRSDHVLNGLGGDYLTGAFLRPSHLLERGEPGRATAFVLASRRFHDRPLASVFKSEVLAQVSAPTEDRLRAVMERYPCERLGNTLLAYWLRHYSPRLTVVGLALESPHVRYVTPLVEPAFVRAVAALPLELRFLSRTYRRALRLLAPELATIRWERVGLSPSLPWPILAAARLTRRLAPGLRSPAVDIAAAFRTSARAWVADLLLARRTRDDGFFLPAYLETLVEEHATGHADRAAEIGMAITLELWRRQFLDREPPALPDLS
jgi:asparagine synthetase B (glutamine-hydrolysing)